MRNIFLNLVILIIGCTFGWYLNAYLSPQVVPVTSVVKAKPNTSAPTLPKQSVKLIKTQPIQATPPVDAKTLLLQQVVKLRQQGKYQQAYHLLKTNEVKYYNDLDVLLQLAAVAEALHDLETAIDYLYQAKINAYPMDAALTIEQRQRDLEQRFTAKLKQQQQWQQLLTFYDRVISREPTYFIYYLGKAEVLIHLERWTEARAALNLARSDAALEQQINELLAIIAAQETAATDELTYIKLRPLGEHYQVTVSINGVSANLLLDTGASFTSISPGIAEQAGLVEAIRQVRVKTANGTVEAPLMQINSMQLDDAVKHEIEAIVLELPDSSEVDGLLGMSFLKHYEFYIDQQTATLVLMPLQ